MAGEEAIAMIIPAARECGIGEGRCKKEPHGCAALPTPSNIAAVLQPFPNYG